MERIWQQQNYLERTTYFLDVFSEAKFEHLVSFVEDYAFQVWEIDVSALNMIEHTTGSTNENIDTIFKISNLVRDRSASINCDHAEFLFVVF